MGWDTNHCCCSLSVKTGVFILGIGSLLSLLSEIDEFYPIRFAVNGVAAIAFILMVADDTESKRKIFFYSFMVSSVV